MNKPKFTNSLINETSPYLLQHAHNPVEWFAWTEAAFEKAKREDKPILISIGYSACHWCHVMEHESFEDEDTARLMNENFVSIKIDLEERPDVDQIYMTFVQMTSGHGGYPLNVFLTPDKKPFFGGTYFPPVSRYNMPSFQRILNSVAEAYRERKEEVLTSAEEIFAELKNQTSRETAGENLSIEQLDSAFKEFAKTFDRINGGFGGAPKFPSPMSLEFLLRYFYRTGDENALAMVEKTCRKMASGGIYDQLGGGFHRYATDAIWLVPHFEKMLYDNAQLARLYLHVFQITNDDFYKRIAVETLDYVQREMTDASGGFYTAQDADSEGVEGKFFVWTPEEITAILDENDARIFNFYFAVSEHGNFEEKNILNVKNSFEKTAEILKIPENELKEVLEKSKKKLFDAREKRVKPFRDEKVLTVWNGLMLSAFAEAGAILDSEEYLETARRNADFILGNLRDGDYLMRTFKDGKAKLNAYVEDYANFADGLIELFQTSGEVKYLKEAKILADLMIAEFWDTNAGAFFFTANNHEELLVRNKDFYDNATPSGNSAAADVLLKLAHLVDGGEQYERLAVTILRLVVPMTRRYPQAFGRALSAMDFHLNPTKEIVVLGKRGNELEREVRREFMPNKVVVTAENSDDADFVPLLLGRETIGGRPTAFVCENFTCQKPVTTAKALRIQIGGK